MASESSSNATNLGIGAQCSFEQCNVQDFLPIQCPGCKEMYCRDHVLYDAHSCSSPPSAPLGPDWVKRQTCSLDNCSSPTLQSSTTGDGVPCAQCQRTFCVEHRHPASHSCAKPAPEISEAKQAARALIAKNFPSSQSKASVPTAPLTRKPPTDPAKLAKYNALELMKMRHKAVPVDPKDKSSALPVGQRIHVRVSQESDRSVEKVFWFRPGQSVGRVLDLLATQMTIKTDRPLSLHKISPGTEGGTASLRTDQPVEIEIENGSELIIVVNATTSV